MSTKGEAFAGLSVALVTPFKEARSIIFPRPDRFTPWRVHLPVGTLASRRCRTPSTGVIASSEHAAGRIR
jgi:hypothetical protein